MFLFFFFNDTATTEIYTLSLHDALPISQTGHFGLRRTLNSRNDIRSASYSSSRPMSTLSTPRMSRSEEHTSELQSRLHLVCRLLLEKKNKPHIPRADNETTQGAPQEHIG